MRYAVGLDASSRNVGWAIIDSRRMHGHGSVARRQGEAPVAFAARAANEVASALAAIRRGNEGYVLCSYEVSSRPIPPARRKALQRCWLICGRVLQALSVHDEVEVEADRRSKRERRRECEAMYGRVRTEHAADALAVAHRALSRRTCEATSVAR